MLRWAGPVWSDDVGGVEPLENVKRNFQNGCHSCWPTLGPAPPLSTSRVSSPNWRQPDPGADWSCDPACHVSHLRKMITLLKGVIARFSFFFGFCFKPRMFDFNCPRWRLTEQIQGFFLVSVWSRREEEAWSEAETLWWKLPFFPLWSNVFVLIELLKTVFKNLLNYERKSNFLWETPPQKYKNDVKIQNTSLIEQKHWH